MPYEPVIGLEIHAQLLTDSKIFCGCSTRFGAPPNTQVCPVCLGLPGALPVLNRRAVEYAVKAALALGCQVHSRSVFARKNYFYPDLPKGYQISQYDQPLASNGALTCRFGGSTLRVGIARVHMEEDAGKSLHEGFVDSASRSYVDFNRSGVPLVEIVTNPDLRSAASAAEFFSRLRAILVWLGVNDGNMEEGSLRCDANVSVREVGAQTLGTKTEVKNLNSFRFLQKALEYEIARQIQILQRGATVTQETRLWNQNAARTDAMRSKEEAHDYRYFPEPDLPPLVLDPAVIGDLERTLPDLPDARKERFMSAYGLPEYDAALLTQSRAVADYFETAAAAAGNPKAAGNWIMGELTRKMKQGAGDIAHVGVSPAALGRLIQLVDQGTISGSVAKDVFEKMYGSGRSADDVVGVEGLVRIDDEAALLAVVRDVITRHPDLVVLYRSGKTATFGFLVGQVMKGTGGKANPKTVNELLRREIERTG